jgi:hypothetical protein
LDKLFPGNGRFFEVRPLFSDGTIRATLNDQMVFVKNPGKKLIGLFDFDGAYKDWKGVWNKSGAVVESDPAKGITRKHLTESGWSMLLPVPVSRSHLASRALGASSALSIELLFDDCDHLPGMIKQEPLPAPGATKPVVVDSMKTAFAEHVTNLPAASFGAFRPIFDRIEEIRAGRI